MTRRNTRAGGCLLTLCILAGMAGGIAIGNPMRGILIGTGIGVLAAVLLWLADRRSPLDDLPSRPDHPADAVDVVNVAIRPIGIGGVVRLHGDPPPHGMERQPLHHHRIVHPNHVNAVA